MRRRVAQAGAIVYRTDPDLEILLVRARRTPDHWIFPKGHIEAGESAGEAALREAREEAGVLGDVVDRIDPPLIFRFGDDDIHVEYFLVKCTGGVDEHEPREKVWLPPPAALTRVTHDAARQLLAAALAKVRM
jgi:8-oxo-dGTP pyrophosphatase MutT (NUDIX family)